MDRRFKNLYSDHWGILEVMVTDHSPIDLKRLAIRDRDDAYHFIVSYGYDINIPEEAEEVYKLKSEAIHFIQSYFLSDLDGEYEPLTVPYSIERADVSDLLLLASSNPRASLQKWACAVLRVMHTLAHVASDLSAHYFADIQEQVLGPYYHHIHQEGDQLFLGTGEQAIPLVEFNAKAGKKRDSAIMKLLHKRENVAADIFDRIGVRFVTHDRMDALLVLRYLREHHLVPFPNVKPSRSVNTLIHIDKFRKTFRELFHRYRNREINDTEFEHILRHSAQFRDVLSPRQVHRMFNRNPFTSKTYRSMQFTVRQLVRITNPLYPFKKDMLAPEDEVSRARFEAARPYYRFFFPYEVQIVDVETHNNNRSGTSSHDVYKQRQRIAARERVLGSLLKPI